ncbi:MAG: apolipoprotein N-acyltransferase [Victivallaceae bacterium]|nr:apolipoprotein N-acyltransferase [Victivallaceae bacterium]
MAFFQENRIGAPINEAWRLSRLRRAARLGIAVAGGLCYAAALPPLNWEGAGFIALVPLLYLLEEDSPFEGALHGWAWTFSWGVFGYGFLREIEPFVPYGVAATIGLWGGVFAYAAVKLRDGALYPLEVRYAEYEKKRRFFREKLPFLRQLGYIAGIAALYTFVEWTRSRIFPWNDLSVTQYRNLALLQLCAFTGSYGVTFCVALAGGGIYAFWRFPKGIFCALAAAATVALVMAGGIFRLTGTEKEADLKPKFLLVQGDLSQRRHAGSATVEESLAVYHALTQRALTAHPDADFVVWPECAIPIPYASGYDCTQKEGLVGEYQRSMRHYRKKMLIGALDWTYDFTRSGQPGVTNSALLLEQGRVLARYDKNHRVPFGEYIPGRALLPQSVIDFIDMGRDLTPGVSHDPLTPAPGLRAGVEICFESIFAYIARDTVRRGANFLVALSNDAWYPTSSEPEQHLANARMRAIETGVPMIRCGNNGGTLVVSPRGRLESILVVPGEEKRVELRRGRGFRLTEVGVQSRPDKTVYLVCGEWFVVLLGLAILGWIVAVCFGEMRHRREFYGRSFGKKNG